MKPLHRRDLYGWSRFDESRNLDFNSVLWVREGGNVAIDPMPLSEHEQRRLDALGGVAHVIITNSDHVRGAPALVAATGAKLYGPAAERERFPLRCDEWLDDGDEPVAGLKVIALSGSKTPGELALLIEGATLVAGDLLRGHVAGRLNLLPDEKLASRAQALSSVRGLLRFDEVDAVLVGDGWPVFRGGRAAIEEIVSGSRTA